MKNEIGKEYDRKLNIIFEGEYSNGVQIGYWKEYFNGKVISEGECFNQKKNGKIKEYNDQGELKYLNGEIWNENEIFKYSDYSRLNNDENNPLNKPHVGY